MGLRQCSNAKLRESPRGSSDPALGTVLWGVGSAPGGRPRVRAATTSRASLPCVSYLHDACQLVPGGVYRGGFMEKLTVVGLRQGAGAEKTAAPATASATTATAAYTSHAMEKVSTEAAAPT